MPLTETLLALHAFEKSAIDRRTLADLLDKLESWRRADLKGSAAALLIEEYGVDPARVRRWENHLAGKSHRLGRYTLVGEIGRGGIGVVFEARHPNLQRPVALKILAEDWSEDPARRSRFEDEIQRLGQLNHPNIVHALDAGHEGDLAYLVMEKVEGETLLERLRRLGPADPEDVIDWILQGSRALEAIGDQGWIHGDVKPSNWILAEGGRLVLTDLGLCRPASNWSRETLPGGTAAYLAPELVLGEGGDIRSDIYSLGATMWHLLTGKRPIQEASLGQLRRRLSQGDLPIVEELKELRPDLPPILVDTIEAMLEFDREGRPADLAALRGRFEPSRPQQKTGKGGGLALLGLVTLVVLSGVLFLGLEPPPVKSDLPPTEAIESPSRVATLLQEDWSRRLSETPLDYRGLFAWLISTAAEDPLQPRWLDHARKELEAEAGPRWAALEVEVTGLFSEGRLVAAREMLDIFPRRFLAGRFDIEHQALSVETEMRIDRRLATMLLEMEAQETPLGRWHLWRQIDRLENSDSLDLKLGLIAEMGGLPFIEELQGQLAEAMETRSERSQQVARSIGAGEVPLPDYSDPDRLPEEVALLFLAEHRELLTLEGNLESRLLESGLITDTDLGLWPLLELLLVAKGDGVNPAQEREAAKILEQGMALASLWNLEALSEWQRLDDGSSMSLTAAAREVSGKLSQWRNRLRRGVFQRSGALAASVEGEWNESTRFSWENSEVLLRDWRHRERAWRLDENGISPKQQSGRLECSFPFSSIVEVSVDLLGHLAQPLKIGWGDDVILLDPAPGSESDGKNRFRLWREGDRWTSGAEDRRRSQPIGDSMEPRWLWIEFGSGATLLGVEVVGELQGVWSDRRQILWESPREDRK